MQAAKTPEPDSDIPSISYTTASIFKDLNSSPLDGLTYPLAEKTKTLKSTVAKLKDAKDNNTMNKIFGVLKAALHIAIIVGGVLGCIAATAAGPGAVAGVAIGALLAAYALGNIYAMTSECAPQQNDCVSVWANSVIGFIWPLIEEFGKVDRNETEVKKLKQEVAQNYELQKKFFEGDLSLLIKALESKIIETEDSLKAIRQLPMISEDGIKETTKKSEIYKKALFELKTAIVFYTLSN
ncbi:MAG: hypothetical protein H0X29_07285 [Parachlamydiaceae bacterium]|nr:hypothetical protein [Parachlamydiaceae bacterium]